MKNFLATMVTFFLSGCMGMPENVKPVDNFELKSYLGKWYEIARLDHSFERDLKCVSANYSMRDDGGVKVVNRGYSVAKKKWTQAEGKAYFVNSETQGYLKVSFFGPLYGSYIIFDIDHSGYSYSFVSGYNTSMLWLLSKTPKVSNIVINKFVSKAKKLGFDTSKLIFVSQDCM